jgi:hypothetical protein
MVLNGAEVLGILRHVDHFLADVTSFFHSPRSLETFFRRLQPGCDDIPTFENWKDGT